jgi:excisionase family DNA binding protein
MVGPAEAPAVESAQARLVRELPARALPDRLLSVREAGALVGVSPATMIYALTHGGELPFTWVRGSVRIRPDDLEAYLARNHGGEGRRRPE